MLKRLRKKYLCWRYGICPVHNVLLPHGGYNEGRWSICPTCFGENRAKNIHRDTQYEAARDRAIDIIAADWRF